MIFFKKYNISNIFILLPIEIKLKRNTPLPKNKVIAGRRRFWSFCTKIEFNLIQYFFIVKPLKTTVMQKKLSKFLLFAALFAVCINANAQVPVTVLPGNNSTSGNGRAPQGTRLYVRTVYYISAADRKSTLLNSSHVSESRMPSSA